MPEQRVAQSRADDMGDNQRGDAETEYELQRLDCFPAKLPAFVKRPNPETGVDQHGRIEHDGDGEKLPKHRVVADAGGERLHRDIAERMVEEMTDQIGKHHQAASEADLPDAHSADPLF
jgi:hypothetical protein